MTPKRGQKAIQEVIVASREKDTQERAVYMQRMTERTNQPESMAIRGAYVHSASKITMPEGVAGFRRDSISRYDVDGLDVSAAYNLVTLSDCCDCLCLS